MELASPLAARYDRAVFGFPLREFELTHLTEFSLPVFDIYFRWGQLYTAIMKQLAPFGAKPEDMRYEGNNPSAFVMACYLSDFTVALRFRIGAVEFWTRKDSLAQRDLPPILIGIGRTVLTQVTDSPPVPSSQVITVAGHFDIAGEGLRERLKRYSSDMPNGGPLLAPAGVVWDGTLPTGAKVSVRLERSLTYQEPAGTFFRVEYKYDGVTPIEESWKDVRGFLVETLGRLGLAATAPDAKH